MWIVILGVALAFTIVAFLVLVLDFSAMEELYYKECQNTDDLAFQAVNWIQELQKQIDEKDKRIEEMEAYILKKHKEEN